MSEEKDAHKKSAAESFGEMLNQFGSALSEIFKDPALKDKTQEFAQSAVKAARTFAERFKDEDVKSKLRDAGKAAQECGRNLTDYFGDKKYSEKGKRARNSQKGRLDETADKIGHIGQQVGDRVDDYFRHTRGGRLVSYNLAIVWSFIFVIVFNFFHQYIAYYHYETVHGVGQWLREPLLTGEFNQVLPILTTALILSILGNGILIVFDRYVLRQGIGIVLHVFGLATVVTFLVVFPFDFSVIPAPAVQVLSVIVAVILVGVAIGLVVGIVVRIVKIVVALIRG